MRDIISHAFRERPGRRNRSGVSRREMMVTVGVLSMGSVAGCLGTDDESSDDNQTDAENAADSEADGEEGTDGNQSSEGDEENETEDGDESDAETENDYTLAVTIVDGETGNPIEDGTVGIAFLQDWWPARPTDDEGTVYFEGVPTDGENAISIDASAAGYRSQHHIVTIEGKTDHIMWLEQENPEIERAILTVTVLSPYDNEPEFLATVRLERNGEEVDAETSLTEGTVHFSVEDGATYTVHAQDEGQFLGEETVTIDGDTDVTLQRSSDEADDR